MYVVCGTQKFRDRVHEPLTSTPSAATTVMGDWYANVLFWKPQLALFVDERTLLPVVVPLAPAATVIARFPESVAAVLAALGTPQSFIDAELAMMTDHQLQPTRNRSVLGTMNDFAVLADAHRAQSDPVDLLGLSLWLAKTPCGPLRDRHGSPDRELTALVSHEPES
jgi:hypothetical protein